MEQHLVQKYTFDVGFDSESKSFQFQNQLADLIKDKLIDLSDEIFTDFSTGKEISIEKLTVDLGTLPFDKLEESLCSIFKIKLSEKLAFLLSGSADSFSEEKIEYILKKESNFKILEYFFTNGMLPWSAVKESSNFSIQNLVKNCLSDDSIQVKKIFASLILKKETQLRIIRQLDDITLWEILETWKDIEVVLIKKFYSDIILVLKSKSLLNYYSESREVVWKFIFNYTIQQGKGKYIEKVWLTQFVEFTAREINTTPENVLKLLITSINEINNSNKRVLFKTPLLDLIKQNPVLLTENKVIDSFEKNNATSQEFEKFRQDQIIARIEFLVNFIKVAQYNLERNELKLQREKSEIIIKELFKLDPSALKKAFMDGYFDIKSFYSQLLLESFSPEVKEILLKEIFVVSINQFEEIKNETIKRALIVLFDTGNIPYSVLPVPIKKTIFNKLILDYFKKDAGELIKIAKVFEDKVKEKKDRILHIKNILTPQTIKILFAEYSDVILLDKSFKTSSPDFNFKLSDYKIPENFIKGIQFVFEKKSLHENFEFSVAQLIEKFISLYKDLALAYFSSVKEKDLKVLQKMISPELINKISEKRYELNKAFKYIKQDVQLKKIDEPVERQLKKSEIDVKGENKSRDFDLKNNRSDQNNTLENKTESKDPVYNFKERNSEEPIYINNAGIIVFHPYLTRFFKMLNLLDNKTFKDEYSSHKAVYILQYLVNKGLNNEEHELVLNKLLCGIDINIPLIRDIEISEEEKSTCESLIEGVIQNWPILKKTSNDNFRASFLIREGRLMLNPHVWKLKVEERGYDILVEKIPWSLSIIKLPWMEKMLNVEWK